MRHLLCGFLAMLVALTPSRSQEHASPPDGIYKPTSLEAHVTFGGKRLNLPIKALRNALLRDGLILVRDRRVPLQKSKWGPLLEKFNFLGINGNASVTAPEGLVFKRRKPGREDRFSARLSNPLRIKIKGRYKWVPVTVEMNTPLDSIILGDIFTIDAPLTVSALTLKATGSIRMTAEKKAPLPPQ